MRQIVFFCCCVPVSAVCSLLISNFDTFHEMSTTLKRDAHFWRRKNEPKSLFFSRPDLGVLQAPFKIVTTLSQYGFLVAERASRLDGLHTLDFHFFVCKKNHCPVSARRDFWLVDSSGLRWLEQSLGSDGGPVSTVCTFSNFLCFSYIENHCPASARRYFLEVGLVRTVMVRALSRLRGWFGLVGWQAWEAGRS